MHPLREAIAQAERELERLSAERDKVLCELVIWDGVTYRDASVIFGISAQRVGQILQRYRAQLGTADTPAAQVQAARESFRLAAHAQQLRAETYSRGHKAETAAFYGAEHLAQADETETRIGGRLGDWHESADKERQRWEEEQTRYKTA